MSNLSIISSQNQARREVLNKNGKVLRHEVVFGKQGGTAAEIKANLRKANPKLKGKALTQAVNNVLSGEKTLRNAVALAIFQKACEDGVTNKIAETSNMLTISVNKPKVTKQDVIDRQAERLEQLERHGL